MPRPLPRLTLAPLDATERKAFLESQAVEYADEKVRAGIWTRTGSIDRAREEIRTTIAAPWARGGHRFYKGLDESGRRVGWIWVGPVPGGASDAEVRWLYQITVEPTFRGQGYGRALLRATEDELRTVGVRELRLNVFAWNAVAISLYRSSGYDTAVEYDSGFEFLKRLD